MTPIGILAVVIILNIIMYLIWSNFNFNKYGDLK